MFSVINSRTSVGNANVDFMSSSIFTIKIIIENGEKKLYKSNIEFSSLNFSIYRCVEIIPKTVCRSITILIDVMHHITANDLGKKIDIFD